jgi:hypothetical protein
MTISKALHCLGYCVVTLPVAMIGAAMVMQLGQAF